MSNWNLSHELSINIHLITLSIDDHHLDIKEWKVVSFLILLSLVHLLKIISKRELSPQKNYSFNKGKINAWFFIFNYLWKLTSYASLLILTSMFGYKAPESKFRMYSATFPPIHSHVLSAFKTFHCSLLLFDDLSAFYTAPLLSGHKLRL